MWNESGVLFDPVKSSISCTCRRFQTFVILCCHALKVIEANGVTLLKRWTRDICDGVIIDIRGNEVEEDPKLVNSEGGQR